MYEENVDLKNEITNPKEKSCDNKKQTNHLGQYLRSSWMLEISGISFTVTEDCRDVITKLVDLANITRFNINQIDIINRTSEKSTAPIIVLFTRKTDRLNFYNKRQKVKGLTNLHFSTQKEVEEGEEQEVILNTNQPQANYKYINESLT